MYKIKYLPIAQRDLWDIAIYILDNLKSAKAATDFIDTFDKSILSRRYSVHGKYFPIHYKGIIFNLKG